ncbi:MAG: hypothetical protein U9Q82_09795 [Chloroflexota bacterium]|nr:hypothetical protein [Chloroflexota bacterium]
MPKDKKKFVHRYLCEFKSKHGRYATDCGFNDYEHAKEYVKFITGYDDPPNTGRVYDQVEGSYPYTHTHKKEQ